MCKNYVEYSILRVLTRISSGKQFQCLIPKRKNILNYHLNYHPYGTIKFTLSIGTPQLLTILVLKLEMVQSNTLDVSEILLYVWQTV